MIKNTNDIEEVFKKNELLLIENKKLLNLNNELLYGTRQIILKNEKLIKPSNDECPYSKIDND